MKSLVEELRAGAELEEAYDADGIIRTGYQPSLRWRAAAEIERLRHEVKIREQICADATLYARRLQEADDEIERLHGLLREAHLALSFMPDPTRKLLDLRYRVREALGE